MQVRRTAWRLLEATQPVHPQTRAALDRRWADLPEHARTPEQSLGRHAIGCEGTHGVFPRCDLTCTPCYHSKDANKVRVDGAHTLAEVDRQMAFLREQRGPRAHAQLIGGEVSLLAPDDHAAALLSMRRHGREPMSMTHGDFDADYLRCLVTDATGRVRLRRVSFAAHMDSLMRGRRGIPRPRSEAELHLFRQRFADMFAALRRELGVRSYLAHNMTVTPANLDQVAEVVAAVLPMGYQMMSFQPAAFLGDDRRWKEGYRTLDIDAVWAQMERGAGTRLPWAGIQLGDRRCNRTAFGLLVGTRWVPLMDEQEPLDAVARDRFYAHLGGVNFGGTPPVLLLAKLARVLAAHPADLVVGLRYGRSLLHRAGGLRRLLPALTRRHVRPMTFVVHAFMDAAQVAPAWDLLERGETSADPDVTATQERLRACMYTMAHPETGKLVPACAQHAVLDPVENAGLRRLLPLVEVR
ncbi:radical SAM domain-containing protein [Kineosporia sp. R_H_3]|uniref:radical SAM domain-containing protein n=1 Tax=Kineosporia sp. R_H_3 TaxID=1961848 RepID=UPI000B4A6D9A|nr:radical SAM domain-containing protein [Kineosporia sp. R_H_3]